MAINNKFFKKRRKLLPEEIEVKSGFSTRGTYLPYTRSITYNRDVKCHLRLFDSV